MIDYTTRPSSCQIWGTFAQNKGIVELVFVLRFVFVPINRNNDNSRYRPYENGDDYGQRNDFPHLHSSYLSFITY